LQVKNNPKTTIQPPSIYWNDHP